MTTHPWIVRADELFALRGSGGERFVEFVSALIRADGAASGVTPEDILTNIRTTIPDGGVDAVARLPIGGALNLATPSCWQFKSSEFKSLSPQTLRNEAKKPEVRRLVALGYCYVFCVCDDASSAKLEKLTTALAKVIAGLNKAAPAPKLLSAGALADWANRHSGVVLQFFRPHQRGGALAYIAWLRRERAEMAHFVEPTSWGGAVGSIRAHVESATTRKALLTVSGPSGAGVSRLVAEALAGRAEMVIYIPDSSSAVELLTSLMNQPTATAILVLDHCRVVVRERVHALLRAEGSRLRAVAIQDPTEEASDVQVVVERLEDRDVRRVLEANFREMDPRHREAVVECSDGSLRVAVELAHAYSEDQPRFLSLTAKWATDQIRRMVPNDSDRRLLEALSLFFRVGYAELVASELQWVCAHFRLEHASVMRACRRMQGAPGVVRIGPCYLSVRPTVFARALFATGWSASVAHNVAGFLEQLPVDLQASFMKQAGRCATPEAREALADWAMPRARALRATDLDPQEIARLNSLVELCPGRFAAILTELIAQMTDEQRRSIGEPALVTPLVDLLERTDTYAVAEAALFRLAQAHGTPQDLHPSSRSVRKWADCFGLLLSGTEVPFEDRLQVLSRRLDTIGTDAVPLVTLALDRALGARAIRMEGPALVFGNVRPREAVPATRADLDRALDAAIELMGRCIADPQHGTLAFRSLARHGRNLLGAGRVVALRRAIDPTLRLDRCRVDTLVFVEAFLKHDATRGAAEVGDADSSERIVAVRAWQQALLRSDLIGRVTEATSQLAYDRQYQDAQAWEKEMLLVGAELGRATRDLQMVLPELLRAEVQGGVFQLGRGLGKADQRADHLVMLFNWAREAQDPLFLRGYVTGLLEADAEHRHTLEAHLDALEAANPGLAADLGQFSTDGGVSGAARAIRLVRTGQLRPERLPTFWTIRAMPRAALDGATAVLDVVDDAEKAATTALRILALFAWDARNSLPETENDLRVLWRAVEIGASGAHGEPQAWAKLLRRLSVVDFPRAVRIACRAAVLGGLSLQEEAADELQAYVEVDAQLILSILGPFLIANKASSWSFLVESRGKMLTSLPFPMLKEWIDANGSDAALILARHLPAPYIDDMTKTPVVPELTYFVLDRFANSDEVFERFCIGLHELQLYSGDIAGQHDREAELARQFTSYPLRRVQEWAEFEMRSARNDARYERQRHEERFGE